MEYLGTDFNYTVGTLSSDKPTRLTLSLQVVNRQKQQSAVATSRDRTSCPEAMKIDWEREKLPDTNVLVPLGNSLKKQGFAIGHTGAWVLPTSLYGEGSIVSPDSKQKQ